MINEYYNRGLYDDQNPDERRTFPMLTPSTQEDVDVQLNDSE